MRALTWNLFHGRSVPGAGRSLLCEFTAALASWLWDVALLQEVPPWWLRQLASATGAAGHSVPTSRNQLLPSGTLSDHPPLMVELRPAARPATSGGGDSS